MADQIWEQELGLSPFVATAIHDGHTLRDELTDHLALDEPGRLREEDPFTGEWTHVAPTRIVGQRSRFEVDLNRPRDKAVYRTPEDAWGLNVWQDGTPDSLFDTSLAEYDRFYREMHDLFKSMVRSYGRFLVFDLHTYNHRRNGPDGPEANPVENPQVNVGTGSADRKIWGPVIDTFIQRLGDYDFPGGNLDVRENVKFQGGNWPCWIHEQFPTTGLAIAIEFKKFFMDEWTGEPNRDMVTAIGDALRSTVPAVLAAFEKIQSCTTSVSDVDAP